MLGLAGSCGTVTFGRDDNPAVKRVQEAADSWAGDTVAGNGKLYDGNIGSSRDSNTMTWRATFAGFGGFGAGAQVAEGDGLDDRPMNFALSCGSGALHMAVGLANPGNADDQFTSLMARYTVAGVTLSALVGTGTDRNDRDDRDVDAWLLALKTQIGGGELRASVSPRDSAGVADPFKQFGVGYHCALSKHTTVYADLVKVKPVAAGREKTGCDIGLRHNF